MINPISPPTHTHTHTQPSFRFICLGLIGTRRVCVCVGGNIEGVSVSAHMWWARTSQSHAARQVWFGFTSKRLTCYKSQPQQRTGLSRLWKYTHTHSECVCGLCCPCLQSACTLCFLQVYVHVCVRVSEWVSECVFFSSASWISDVGGTQPPPVIRARAAASHSLLPALNFR